MVEISFFLSTPRVSHRLIPSSLMVLSHRSRTLFESLSFGLIGYHDKLDLNEKNEKKKTSIPTRLDQRVGYQR